MPLAGGNRLILSAVACADENDKPRKISGFGTETVQQPRPHARATGNDAARIHERMRRIMIDLLGVHRADQTQIIRHSAQLLEMFAHFQTALAIPLESPLGAQTFEGLTLQLGQLLAFGETLRHVLPVQRGQLWFGIECFQMARSAGLIEIDDSLRSRGEVELIQNAAPAQPGGRGSL